MMSPLGVKAEVRTVAPDVYDEHEASFGRMSDRLEECYQGYTNGRKLIALLSYWLYAYRCILACYGSDAARRFCRSGFRSHLRFAYSYEHGVDIALEPRTLRSEVLFRLVAGHLRGAYLPGGRVDSLRSKVLLRLTSFASLNTPLVIQDDRRRSLGRILASYFDDEYPGHAEGCQQALPSAFVADQVEVAAGHVLPVDCSAMCFMDFCGYENLFLFDRPIHVIGLQHGGGYDMFTIDYLMAFEKQLCDEFIGWGLSCVNARQHKYPAGEAPLPGDQGRKRIVWVERARPLLALGAMNPGLFAQSSNTRVIEYIHRELSGVRAGVCSLPYPGQLKSDDYAGKRGVELGDDMEKGEAALRADDIVLFDIGGASLVHYCIQHAVMFVIVLRRDDLRECTEEGRAWLETLRQAGLVFFDDEDGQLSRGLAEMLSERYEWPAVVREYHRRRFIDI